MGSFLSWAVSTSIRSGPLGQSTAMRSGKTKLKRGLSPSTLHREEPAPNTGMDADEWAGQALACEALRMGPAVLSPDHVSGHSRQMPWRSPVGLGGLTAGERMNLEPTSLGPKTEETQLGMALT